MSDNLEAVLHTMQKSIVAKKSRFNSFGKYNYRSCEDIVDAAKDVMPDGVALVMYDRIVKIGDRYYVEATAEITDSGGSIRVTALAREANEQKGMSDAQLTGSASSYARKYALCGLFAIDDGIDDDGKGGTLEKKAATPPKVPNPPKVETPEAVRDRLIAAINKQPQLVDLQKFCKLQAVIDARDKLFMDNSDFSAEVDQAVKFKLDTFEIQSPSGL